MGSTISTGGTPPALLVVAGLEESGSDTGSRVPSGMVVGGGGAKPSGRSSVGPVGFAVRPVRLAIGQVGLATWPVGLAVGPVGLAVGPVEPAVGPVGLAVGSVGPPVGPEKPAVSAPMAECGGPCG
jgi:hypothetical protein